MFSLLVVLFFSVTGITLNHPEWSFGFKETKQEVSGVLPTGWKTAKGTDWLTVADYLRQKHHVHGTVADRRDEDTEGSVSFKAPGYAADCFFDERSGAYRITILSQGPIGVLNDLHRGRDAGSAWSKLIDLSAIFLVLISLTGIGLIFYLKKMRVSGMVTFAVGCVIMLLLIRMAS
ncbi:MAG: peptidase [Chthonomonadales bacterium]|nr:peptidase [Chthonomonadales bacterium]